MQMELILLESTRTTLLFVQRVQRRAQLVTIKISVPRAFHVISSTETSAKSALKGAAIARTQRHTVRSVCLDTD